MAGKHRGNQEGSVYQRKSDGRWVAASVVDGKRHVRYGRTRQEAAQKLRDLHARQDKGLPMTASTLPRRDYLEQWLATVKTRVRPSTYEMYEVIVRVHLTPAHIP